MFVCERSEQLQTGHPAVVLQQMLPSHSLNWLITHWIVI